MRRLCFIVNGQSLSKSGDFKNLVRGSKGYLKTQFSFSSDWSGLKKVAIYQNGETTKFEPIIRDMAAIPDEIAALNRFYVSVIGVNDETTITTNKVNVEQR